MRNILIIVSVVIKSLFVFSQKIFDNVAIGINLTPLISNTLDLKFEINPHRNWTYQLSAGGMLNRKTQYISKSDYTDDHISSGIFTSVGQRYNTRKEINKSTFFLGWKFIGGYFDQRGIQYPAIYDTITEIGAPVHKTGFFIAVGVETGSTIKITDRFWFDMGIQFTPPIYKDEQVSELYSILPGISPFLNLQVFIVSKFYITKQHNS